MSHLQFLLKDNGKAPCCSFFRFKSVPEGPGRRGHNTGMGRARAWGRVGVTGGTKTYGVHKIIFKITISVLKRIYSAGQTRLACHVTHVM